MPFVAAWHGWAVASVIFAGVFSFLLKVGAERTHSSAIFNVLVSVSSLVLSILGIWWYGESISSYVLVLAVLNGLLYIVGTVARSDALSHIDATLFFPIYKIVGPALVLLAGVAFLGERLTFVQAVGFAFALSVPLLLLDRLERARQKDLGKGVWLAIVAAVLISAGQVLAKMAMNADAGPNIFAAIPYAMTIVGISIPYAYRHKSEAVRVSRWRDMVWLGLLAGVFQYLGFVTLLFAFESGPVSTAYAINSTYILIPIVLSIWYYGEHWNARKVIAIALSIGAVVLLR